MSHATVEPPPLPVLSEKPSNAQKNKLKSYVPEIPQPISEESLDTNVFLYTLQRTSSYANNSGFYHYS